MKGGCGAWIEGPGRRSIAGRLALGIDKCEWHGLVVSRKTTVVGGEPENHQVGGAPENHRLVVSRKTIRLMVSRKTIGWW